MVKPVVMWDTSDENSKGYTITTSYDGKKHSRDFFKICMEIDPHVTVWKEDITFEEERWKL